MDTTAYVADTVHHQLKSIDLESGEVTVLAGTGEQWMQGDSTDRLSSPWAVAWWQDRVWIAMAGIHQLWTFDPATGRTEVAGGTTNEGLLDGPLAEAWFAQPSGLAVDGERLWLADAETSSLRYVEAGAVHTVIGEGLFDFGFRDGPAGQALLQHPLGVCVLPDGSVTVCDTYNGAIRRYEPATGEVTTLASGLAEPSAAYRDGMHLVVVESTAHRLTRVPLGAAARHTDGFSHTSQRPVTEVAAELELVVAFTPPPGQKVDDRFGPPSQLVVEATPPALLREGEGRGTDLNRRLVLDPAVGEGVLHVAARAASCDIDGENARLPHPPAGLGRPDPHRCWRRRRPEPAIGRLRWATATTWSRSTTTCTRANCAQLRELVEEVERGHLEAGEARHAISTMTLRQNDWTLGIYCQTYCRVVTMHPIGAAPCRPCRLRVALPTPRSAPTGPDGRLAPPDPSRAGAAPRSRAPRPRGPAARRAIGPARGHLRTSSYDGVVAPPGPGHRVRQAPAAPARSEARHRGADPGSRGELRGCPRSAQRVLPGARVRRRLFYRYTLSWER